MLSDVDVCFRIRCGAHTIAVVLIVYALRSRCELPSAEHPVFCF